LQKKSGKIMALTYKDSGVDIQAGDKTVDLIKPLVKSTHNDKVLSEIGLFGGFFDGRFPEYEHPVLVASTDGVGTKLKVAFMADKHDTVGHDLVNHCTDDILACGAKPLFFLDYFATGKLNPEVAAKVVEGFVKGCRENECALIGGETAEMPSIYSDGEYDMSGTIVGVVDKAKIVNGSTIQPGDRLIGLPSDGLHTNGYSLARAALFPKYRPDQYIEELGMTVAESLLRVHKSYLKPVLPLVEKGLLRGISHITGGGIEGNTKRILPEGTKLDIDWSAWERPAIFNLIQKSADVPEDDMRRTFNLGIGMILAVSPDNFDSAMAELKGEGAIEIGGIWG
jgi:phosphoribosylformylglycinamidine cyclo-ligase